MIQIKLKCIAGAEPKCTEHCMTEPTMAKGLEMVHSISQIEIHVSVEGHHAENLYLT